MAPNVLFVFVLGGWNWFWGRRQNIQWKPNDLTQQCDLNSRKFQRIFLRKKIVCVSLGVFQRNSILCRWHFNIHDNISNSTHSSCSVLDAHHHPNETGNARAENCIIVLRISTMWNKWCYFMLLFFFSISIFYGRLSDETET